MRDLITNARLALHACGEYRTISIDATYKLALKVMGQRESQKHNWVTIVGMRGALLGIEPACGEAVTTMVSATMDAVPDQARQHVAHVASDVCSNKLSAALLAQLPGLRGVSLDVQHVSFKVDAHTKKWRVKPKLVGCVVRVIMAKFEIPIAPMPTVSMYAGGPAPPLTRTDLVYRSHIRNGSLPLKEAQRVLTQMDPLAPITTLTCFAHLLAAVVRVYPEHMDIKRGKNKTSLRGTLLHVTTPEQFQWLLNNQRFRSTLPNDLNNAMASGTTRNEQYHSRLNAHFREVTQIAKRTLAAELKMWVAADISVSVRMTSGKWSRKISRADLLPPVAAQVQLFSADAWLEFAQVARTSRPATPLITSKSRKRRRSASSLQTDVFAAIQAKLTKKHRSSLIDAI